jgi:hypothetical protein
VAGGVHKAIFVGNLGCDPEVCRLSNSEPKGPGVGLFDCVPIERLRGMMEGLTATL